MGIGIILPIIFKYKEIISSDLIDRILYILILISGYLVLSKNQYGLGFYLIIQSIWFAKKAGVILKKYSKLNA